MRELERRVVLSVLDRKWREHLYEMDYLQEGIGLRAMAQRDPLVEYQREGFDMFAAMMDAIKEESVGFLFNLEVQVEAPAPAPAPAGDEPQLDQSLLAAAQQSRVIDEQAVEQPHITAKGLERNDAKVKKPLVYSSPALGSDAPQIRRENASPDGASGGGSTPRRQQARANPNRGSRGNRGSGARRRKR